MTITKRYDNLCATIVSATTICGSTLSATSLNSTNLSGTGVSGTTISGTGFYTDSISGIAACAGGTPLTYTGGGSAALGPISADRFLRAVVGGTTYYIPCFVSITTTGGNP
jgi:hypothetical protein